MQSVVRLNLEVETTRGTFVLVESELARNAVCSRAEFVGGG